MKYSKILNNMTLEEKISLCSGKDFWHTKDIEKYGIPSIMMSDGPHGLRKQENAADMLGMNESVPATSFPTAVTTGCSFDTDLLGEIGAAIATEARANQVAVVLGPGANLKRNPLCGRNFEYFSEDPYLTGKLAGAYISKAQQNGVASSLKHFACNNQEYKRFSSNSVMDERTMRELYLTAFEIAVKESKPRTIMCSYNKVNGVHSSDNKKLLTDILRKDWGYEGLVVTDWGAMSDRIAGFVAGCDLSMPGGSDYMEKEVREAVEKGILSESDVDACADRVLALVMQCATAMKEKTPYNKEVHHKLACRAAEESAVLLKNENNILPIARKTKVALIGSMADKPRYQGAGSSHITPTKLERLTEVIPEAVYAAGCEENGDTNDELLREAVRVAREAEIAVICAGLTDRYESEGFDRENMKMPIGHLKMIDAVAKANPNTIVILTCGSVVETPWAGNVKAILYMGLPGQAGARAIRNLLYGEANPSGRLAETWPIHYEDCPSSSYYGNGYKDAQYREGVYVGYRYYDKAQVPVRWNFGFGLSYTDFQYSDCKMISITNNILESNAKIVNSSANYNSSKNVINKSYRDLINKPNNNSHSDSNDKQSISYQLEVTITNIGEYPGAEVVQLYIGMPQDGIHRPIKELKGFKKVFLQPKESKVVTFNIDDRKFAVWSDGWKIPSGEYQVFVGGTPCTLNNIGIIKKAGTTIGIPEWQKGSWYENPLGAPSKEIWEKLLGEPYEETSLIKGKFTMDNTVLEMKDYSFLMKIMYKAVEKTIAKGFGGKVDYSIPEFKMMMSSSADCSLSGMQINGAMKGNLMKALLAIANGHFLKGVWLLIKK